MTAAQTSDRVAVKKLMDEAAILHSFNSPSVVQFYGAYFHAELSDLMLVGGARRRGGAAPGHRQPPAVDGVYGGGVASWGHRPRRSNRVADAGVRLWPRPRMSACVLTPRSPIAQKVVSGLEFLEGKRTLHRDIKPSNILASTSGQIKLCDFGESKVRLHALHAMPRNSLAEGAAGHHHLDGPRSNFCGHYDLPVAGAPRTRRQVRC